MDSPKRGLSAKQLVREYGSTLSDFTSQVDDLVTKLADSDVTLSVAQRRREVCAAVWAAITAAFEASSLSAEEKEKLSPLLQEVLIPYWQQHCASDPGMAALLADRATSYLRGRDPSSQVATATAIVRRLLDAIGAGEEPKRRLSRRLIALFTHRMLGDTHYINGIKNRFAIQLSTFAAIWTLLGISQVVEPALKLLRLS